SSDHSLFRRARESESDFFPVRLSGQMTSRTRAREHSATQADYGMVPCVNDLLLERPLCMGSRSKDHLDMKSCMPVDVGRLYPLNEDQ
ncbi:MAG: hypothetical protein Q9212_007481, partial [Teloschistes hypoglaucus]